MTAFDIDDEFEEFMRQVNPTVDQTSVQWRECRRMFAGGAAVMFGHFFSLNDVSDAEAEKELQQIKAQLNEFFYKRVGFSD